jgi:hypothetical protein
MASVHVLKELPVVDRQRGNQADRSRLQQTRAICLNWDYTEPTRNAENAVSEERHAPTPNKINKKGPKRGSLTITEQAYKHLGKIKTGNQGGLF